MIPEIRPGAAEIPESYESAKSLPFSFLLSKSQQYQPHLKKPTDKTFDKVGSPSAWRAEGSLEFSI